MSLLSPLGLFPAGRSCSYLAFDGLHQLTEMVEAIGDPEHRNLDALCDPGEGSQSRPGEPEAMDRPAEERTVDEGEEGAARTQGLDLWSPFRLARREEHAT